MVLLLCKNEGRMAMLYGWKKAEAYSGEKVGRQSRKEKIEYKRTGAGEGIARLSEVASAGSEE